MDEDDDRQWLLDDDCGQYDDCGLWWILGVETMVAKPLSYGLSVGQSSEHIRDELVENKTASNNLDTELYFIFPNTYILD